MTERDARLRPVLRPGFRDALPILLLGALWGVLVLLVDPRGNFPLNDDWSYGRAAFTLAEEGRVRLLGWTAMPLVGQLPWGALFCAVFGRSFGALRASTLVLGLAGILAVHAAAREAGASRRVAWLSAAAVGANPIYLLLASTFMTDVPFFAVAAASFVAFLRGLRRSSGKWIAVGTVLSIAATLIRQFGLVVPIAFAVGAIAKNGARLRSVVLGAAPAGLSWAALAIFERILAAGPGLPAVYKHPGRQLASFFAQEPIDWFLHPLEAIGIALVYAGLFCLPALLASWRGVSRRGLAAIALWIVASAGATGVLASRGFTMPLTGNILWESGIGPPTLRDVYIEFLPSVPLIPAWVWLFVMFAGIAAGGLVVRRSASVVIESGRGATRTAGAAEERGGRRAARRGDASGPPRPLSGSAAGSLSGASPHVAGAEALPESSDGIERSAIVVMSVAMIVVYLLLFATGDLYDRYLLFLLPPLTVLLVCASRASSGESSTSREKMMPSGPKVSASSSSRDSSFRETHASLGPMAAATAAIFLSASVAVAGTHDYFAWQRARWLALRDLVSEKHVPPASIDGGFEFNGYYLYDPSYRPPRDKSWWWVHDDEYRIAFGPMTGWREIARAPYRTWLPPDHRSILTLRREAGR